MNQLEILYTMKKLLELNKLEEVMDIINQLIEIES